MRFIGLLLVVAIAGLACEKSQTPSNGGKPSESSVEGSRAINGDDTKANGAVAVAGRASGSAALARSAPAVDSEIDQGGVDDRDGDGEPMDDAVPVTDRSGAAAPLPEHAGSEAIEVELEQ
jgi:hypothetical protein